MNNLRLILNNCWKCLSQFVFKWSAIKCTRSFHCPWALLYKINHTSVILALSIVPGVDFCRVHNFQPIFQTQPMARWKVFWVKKSRLEGFSAKINKGKSTKNKANQRKLCFSKKNWMKSYKSEEKGSKFSKKSDEKWRKCNKVGKKSIKLQK